MNSQAATERLKYMIKEYKIPLVALQEPFIKESKIESYKYNLGMHGAYANNSNKIWIFWGNDIDCSIYCSEDQMVACKVVLNSSQQVFISVVYAKSRTAGREDLWRYMRVIASTINEPWVICGDFNSILSTDEKMGDCGLKDNGFSGNIFTWSNERKGEEVIWKRLDRMISNEKWSEAFAISDVIHLPRVNSDHCPLLITGKNSSQSYVKYFRFLNFWTEIEGYQEIELEEGVMKDEEKYMESMEQEDRISMNKAKAELILQHKHVDNFWRQKANLKWNLEGDENTKFFHSVVKGRRKYLHINRICDNGVCIEREEEIDNAAVQFYQNLFSQQDNYIDLDILKYVPIGINSVDNEFLSKNPSEEEVKNVVLTLIQTAQLALMDSVIDAPQTFSDFRPISLSNVTQKIISKVFSERLSTIIPKIISSNQSGFIKGRAIGENVLLAQEIIHDMKRQNNGGNVAFKIDMNKAYDRLSSYFLCAVMRKMGFDEKVIFIIWNMLANNWYSEVVNGKRHGFFKSQRGVKQGDPISPALFIIAAESLSCMLNELYNNPRFRGFIMQATGPKINHLAYADDLIIFCAGKTKTLNLIMKVLEDYSTNSGQKINGDKSYFIMDKKTSNKRSRIVKNILQVQRQEFPITYLGCPLFQGRKLIQYFADMATKIIKKVNSWNYGRLSTGGKFFLIKHVLSAMPVHLLAICKPPKTIFKQMEQIFANFLWGNNESKNKYHWAKWFSLCMPTLEGGIGIRSLQDISESFSAKLWWQFRTKESLWAEFFKAKYARRIHPVARKWSYSQSHNWRRMMEIKKKIDHLILWRINKGNASFWWDNWSGLGDLAQFGDANTSVRGTVAEYIVDGTWNVEKLKRKLYEHIVHQIRGVTINSPSLKDNPIWTVTTDGRFNCKSAWNTVRRAQNPSLINKMMWHKKSPFKLVMVTHKQFQNVDPYISWMQFIKIIEQAKTCIKSFPVKWSFPADGCVKLNTDGCSKGNPGNNGGGGVIRNNRGFLIAAYGINFGITTNNVAEALAMKIGIDWCTQNGYKCLDIESDSKLLVDWIMDEYNPPWNIIDTILDIKKLLEQADRWSIAHCYREGNRVANSLSNWGLNFNSITWITEFHNLPKEVKGEMNMDRMQMPTFRNNISSNCCNIDRRLDRNYSFDVP
ncbi:uncharacterized protein LOC132624540 [Lycium barbarum]|uniref:uncharacterized protein LOC132624540 n=1 Tax=Lycium barbarum TaxID=112863 RepID=UPI00293F2B87|nr:uncharacterized protein LOC132624540 [Lycium barbarum]